MVTHCPLEDLIEVTGRTDRTFPPLFEIDPEINETQEIIAEIARVARVTVDDVMASRKARLALLRFLAGDLFQPSPFCVLSFFHLAKVGFDL